MLTVLLSTVLSFSLNPLDESNNWTKLDTALTVAELGAGIADYGSTRWCLQNMPGCYESNKIFGKYPNKLGTFVSAIIIPIGEDVIVARLLPTYIREIWQVLYFGDHLLEGPISNWHVEGGIHFAF